MNTSDKQLKLEQLRHEVLRVFAEHVSSTGSVPILDATAGLESGSRDSAPGSFFLEGVTDTATIVSEAVSGRSVTADEDSLKNVSVLAEKLREQ